MFPKEERDDFVEVYGDDEGHGVVDVGDCQNPNGTGFDALGTTTVTSADDQRGIWELDDRAQQQNLLQEMNDPSIFYNDQFPQIPDFPCMSSSSSSSSVPALAKPISSARTTSSASSASSSTSSAASWAVLKSDDVTEEEEAAGEELEKRTNKKKRNHRMVVGEVAGAPAETIQPPLTGEGSGSIDCMDVMENFGYMDLIDTNEIWDPSTIFDQSPEELQQEQMYLTEGGNSNGSEVVQEDSAGGCGGGTGGGGDRLDELGAMFFEWLKSNKEFISAEDMRNIKLKKSTVECASKRLGSSKEGKKQLLKLILEWVQQHQLQRKNSGEAVAAAAPPATPGPPPATTQYPFQYYQGVSPPPAPPPPPQFHNPNPSFNCNSSVPVSDPNQGFPQATWIAPAPPFSPYMAEQATNGMAMVAAQPPPPPTFSYMGGGGGDPYNHAMNCQLNPYNNPGSGEFQVLESAQSWNPSQITMAASPYSNQFPDMGTNYAPQIMPLAAAYPDQYPYSPQVYGGNCGGEQQLVRLGSSATKEARKKRMARQRRIYSHHHHHHRHSQLQNHQNQVANADPHPHAMITDENCTGQSQGGNWLYWPAQPPAAPPAPVQPPPTEATRPFRPNQGDRLAKQAATDKRLGLKTEKNLKFLLQKVLKQSDVGTLGRIVLPKKEAETHLPELDTRDGVSIAMEDIGTSQVWNMRYRFWPNNKSRMYLLENAGDFVKANGLQEGDFIVIYSDVKCGKYLIRGVKVRQPTNGKSEGKKPAKRNQRVSSHVARASPALPAAIRMEI